MGNVKNTIGVSVLLLVIGTLSFLGGSTLNDDNVYYCESRNTFAVMKCDSLSKYYGLENGKCNNAEVGNKLCTTGWIKFENDLEIENKKTNQWLCDTEKCIPKGE